MYWLTYSNLTAWNTRLLLTSYTIPLALNTSWWCLRSTHMLLLQHSCSILIQFVSNLQTLCPQAVPSGVMFTNQIQTSLMCYNYYLYHKYSFWRCNNIRQLYTRVLYMTILEDSKTCAYHNPLLGWKANRNCFQVLWGLTGSLIACWLKMVWGCSSFFCSHNWWG